ncbi:alpha/beta fold hydrolase [Polymorphobacter fuscus]|uniref:Alpha/beta fold hydrolase n=1 Tax=Sandarakinorhabdus fusca TaxID=1439888 RepID=A0A7C9KJ64_9SPHN|nr:alpha/beta hydrolase [Polymorphobacter fuscus]KAB7646569.1 alpha/beta hydrolase [Polymorphobacter fuscus]MQT17821.1 alpha/beta fold hydrolase [Polymorphobacter fuscus]NJC09630.1 pimeloyl-ACP methyl ester carboxylesterase [Polymorphobacter fuscus]
MPMIETDDGTALYFKEWGDGPAVILIHGWPLSADSWDDQAMAIAEHGYRVIAYDRRGFGRSDQPWEGYDYDTLADDLAAVIEACDVEDPALVGFSMGGGEVARYLTRHGGASKVALIASVVPFLLQTPDHADGVPQAVFDTITDGIEKDRADFLKGFLKDFYGVGLISAPVSDAQLEWSLQIALQAGLKGTIDCVEAFSATDFRPDLASFTMPTLIIHGTADKTVPIEITARAAAKAIPHARLVEYDGAPHGLLATHKNEISRDLIAFLDS